MGLKFGYAKKQVGTWIPLKSDHFGIEIQQLWEDAINRYILKSDHFGIEIYEGSYQVTEVTLLKSDHFGIEMFLSWLRVGPEVN